MIVKEWKGKSFREWCAIDVEDTRKINYTLHKIGLKPEVFAFTSEDNLDGLMLHRVQRSTIKSLSLVNNEWYAILEC